MKPKTQTLLIEFASGTQAVRAEVPLDATVTFGGLIPGAKVDGGSNRTALRVYKGKRQIAVFTGVLNFRFIDEVAVLEKRVQHAVKNVVVDEDGVKKARSLTVTTEDWVNPDAVEPSKTAETALKQLSIEAS